MMDRIYTIENEWVKAEIHALGAELRGLMDKRDEKQLLWSGDGSVWDGVSPLLFPVVGKLKGDKYGYAGGEYALPIHGFARKTVFAPALVEQDRVELLIESNDETRKVYPFDFALTVGYRLVGKRIDVTFHVENGTDGEMWFSIGAHPGIACGQHGRIVFEECELPLAYKLTNAHLLPATMTDLPVDDYVWQLKEDTFARDAFILEKPRSKYVIVERNRRATRVKVTFGEVPYLGIWAKPGAEYVCIEPWFGVDDPETSDGDIRNKPGIVGLPKDGKFEYTYSIERLGDEDE